jgi:hypothetical protein
VAASPPGLNHIRAGVLLSGEYDMIMGLYRQRLEEWQAWRHLSPGRWLRWL